MTDEEAHGWGLATVVTDGASAGSVLDVWFPSPSLGTTPAEAAAPEALERLAGDHAVRRVRTEVRHVRIDLAEPPHDASGRLPAPAPALAPPRAAARAERRGHLRRADQRGVDQRRTMSDRRLRGTRALRLRAYGPLQVFGVDKFPRMTDYVVPSGVRIADADRVRLGAHLAEGTTVMHEGFVNYNAGTLGTSMVEGRITAGVVVGHDSDIGGGASIMGTLSGGGKQVVSIGGAA